MVTETGSERATRLLARRNPAALLYGAIITAAVMSATADHDAPTTRVVVASAFVVVVYWLADVYVRAFADQFTHGQSPLPRRLVSAVQHELGVLLGGLPALVVVVAASLLGAGTARAVELGLWLTVIELGAVGYLGSRSAGGTRRTALGEALVAALLGLVMVGAKTFLH